jgi:hypothetical protein
MYDDACLYAAGLNGLFFPVDNTTLQPFERVRERLDDLIDRDYWENWVSQCLASYASPPRLVIGFRFRQVLPIVSVMRTCFL